MTLLFAILTSILYAALTIVLYMIGGQISQKIRRWALPPLQAAVTLLLAWLLQLTLWLSPVQLLDMIGYDLGDKNEWLKGLVSSIPCLVAICILHTNWWLLVLIPVITVSYIPDLPRLGKLWEYDILGRDLLRSSVGAASWILVVWLR